MTQLSALLTSPTVGLYNRFVYIATAAQTVFSGADVASLTMSYKPGYVQVCLNGMVLPNSDYTATNGTSVTFSSGLAAGDVVDVTAWSVIALGDVLQKSQNGADIANAATFRTNLGLTAYANAVLGQIPGTSGTTQPAAGFVGEKVTNTGVLTFAASATPGVVTSLSVTAGVWEIELINQFGGTGATSSTDWVSSISLTSGSISTVTTLHSSYTYIHSRMASNLDQSMVHTSLRFRITPSTTTTYYLNAQATYSGSYSVSGGLQATRVS